MPEKKKSALGGRGGAQRSKGGKDLSGKVELSKEELDDLNDDEFDTYSENLTKNTRQPLKRKAGRTIA